MRINPKEAEVKEPTLDELIVSYYENNQEYKSYKEIVDRDNQKIKEIMDAQSLDKYTVDGITASVSIRQTQTMDESKLLTLLKERNLADGIVKTTEYVDMDELERAMYAGTIPEDVVVEMDKCKNVKETKVLKVTRKKEKDNG